MKIILFIENFLLILITISLSSAHVSSPRKCANEECSAPIAVGRTSITYASPNDINLSFKSRDKVTVYSKPAAETNDDIWYVEINGKRGYAPKKFIVEEKVIVSSSKLITVQNVAPKELPPSSTTTTPPKPQLVRENINNESSPDVPEGVNITKDPSDSTVSNVSEVETEASQERLKRSVDLPNGASNIVNDSESVDVSKSNEVKVEDLNKYDSKNFVESNSEGDDDEEEEEEDDGEDEYDDADAENVIGSEEEEIVKQVIEEPIVKKTAYVTTDSKTESSESIVTNEVQPALEIMAPTQVEIEQLKQQQLSKDSLEETRNTTQSEMDTSIDVDNVTAPTTTVTNTDPVVSANEFTTTTNPIDSPQNPLDISIETTTPLPDVTQNKLVMEKQEQVPASSTDGTSTTSADSTPKVDSASSEKVVLNEEIPPFKPLPPIVENVAGDLKDTPVVDQKIEIIEPVNDNPIIIQESVTPLGGNSDAPMAINERTETEEKQIGKENESVTAKPTEVVDNVVVIDEGLPTELNDSGTVVNTEDLSTVEAETTKNNSVEPTIQDAEVVVENVDTFGYDSNNFTSTSSDDAIVTETPVEILSEEDDIPTVELVKQNVNEGIGYIEPILQTPNTAEPLQADNNNNLMNEPIEDVESKEGFFSVIINSVKNLFGGSSTVESLVDDQSNENFDKALNDILFSQAGVTHKDDNEATHSDEYCENISPNSCPRNTNHQTSNDLKHPLYEHGSYHGKMDQFPETETLSVNNYNDFLAIFMGKLVDLVDVIVYVVITAIFVLAFTLGYYCITNNRKEGSLLSKLNILERKLMTSSKECDLLKCDLVDTRNKLASIEDNSFGSNEMVIALKRELDTTESERAALQDQVLLLEKELETAAEAGLELNKMVSELLNNQSGSDSIISSVEELQHQLNEQQATTESINALLAEKSRENSELQILLSEKSIQFESELESLQNLTDRLQAENTDLKTQVEVGAKELEQQFNRDLKIKTAEITKISKELSELRKKHDEIGQANRTNEARVQVLDNLLKQLKKEDGVDLDDLMSTADMKTKLLALTKERESLIDRLDGEVDARKLLEDHVKVVSEEVSSLRQEYSVAEKDKLEAQTRLEVLSTYFKDKEMQLQKELSLKEAMTMKQQGETSSTVERIRSLQTEIQELKSQNDSLKAEIEAQIAAHKAQMGAAENRAHESWLSARQAERRIEEARSEATALRRKLTSIVGNSNGIDNNLQNRHNSLEALSSDLPAQSPFHVEQSGSSLLMGLPPPFLPPPPFMPLMPPPFMPASAEMRQPPLGRLISPPPNRYSPGNLDDRDRYDHRGRYSPNDRYNYSDNMSQYETETDFSPPGSPEPRMGYRDRNYKQYSPSPPLKHTDSRSKTNSNKGGQSSGSVESMGSRKSQGNRKMV